ncbi:MAG: hypothetical protein OXT07_16255 [bacterium]|nr:hypothetical protein [bacterium]MDE0215410.1 hypothetical protein [bacterium]
MAFSDFELSVDVARIQKDISITLQDGVGVAQFVAGEAQNLGQQTVANPLEENPSHALVIGKKTKAVKRKIRNASTFTMREEFS